MRVKTCFMLMTVLFITDICALEIKKTGRFGEALMEVRLRSFNNTGGSEIYLGVASVGTAGNRTELNHTWTQDNWLEINYDSGSDLLRVTLFDGLGVVINSVDYPNWQTNMISIIGNGFSIQNLNAMQIALFDREADGELSFEDVELDGVSLGGDFDTPAGKLRPVVTRWLLNDYCFADFNLYGRIVRSGTFSNS
ncbi:hypothetical protein [Marinicella sp. W31]|uniref:hypothetical protein n=1 Tax=Marinicella sp. W31 TaxID=3023713 RepID=UPI003756E637